MKRRIEWIDVSKSVAIILVIFGHACKKTTWNYSYYILYTVYSFHMALFFVLSGWTLKFGNAIEDLKAICISKVKRIGGGVFIIW